MSAIFTQIFVAVIVVSLAVRVWLGLRHIRHIQQHRQQVPVAFQQTISLEAHQRAADYTSAKVKLRLNETIIESLVLLALTLGGILQTLDQVWQQWLPAHEIIRGALVICSAMLISGLATLPFDYIQTFKVDEEFGFNKMSPAMFFSDMIKHSVVGVLLGGPILFAALWLMQSAGEAWWLYLWLIWSAFNLFMLAVYPVWIAPLFNKFTPMQDQTLKARIEALMQKCGFASQGLFVMDGSTRSGHGNAYFTGFGKNKRVVFFDTLLEKLNADEIEAVLAHELGHFKHQHVIKRIAMMFGLSLVGLALLGYLIKQEWFFTGLGVAQASNHMALLLFVLVSPVFMFILRPVLAAYSRTNEFEADHYAAQQSRPAFLIDALVKLYRDNASTLTPDPLHSAFYDSHPPASLRIAKLETYA
ncbi:M48 family metallopeptidase [Methylophilus medardicus]|uniref:M48 family metallopeptidase n=1 Tax=Methylophilus medardicus TaxID=2588534 RepID=A0A5B8CRW8_9PROT|nr:M48 family metallopeptidase [Methylophilus medardicus]QDC43997.1 M48 family metallopeptidase [Methylophilus medardicus]QDC49004.1 M48 family metallopeptidase [Methylophilus medardicus]QDC52709.1 M48 family metallopeptidase [Methylophilus medardicus]